MRRCAVLLALPTLASFLACSGLRAPLGPPATSGTYTPSAGGLPFTVDPQGVFDNGDNMNCATGVVGATITLDCHGWRVSADWVVAANGDVDTNLIDVLYGEREAVSQHYVYTP